MRIQHNIMAMNAYRNYNTNTSALSKNLEKLSSGYKINRAGDDAAGLAISEKMRAQITGLTAATKNVKDGISLVKTAEGAMQEIHDMLNRMDYLATQSANGTYDNDVDRANLQKEVDSLRNEINRIADSANFNGIKLLDGSLKENKVAAIDAFSQVTKGGDTLNILNDSQLAATATAGVYTIDLSQLKLTNMASATKKLSKVYIGGATAAFATISKTKGQVITGSDIAAALKTKYTGTSTGKQLKIGSIAYKVSTQTGGKLTLEMVAAPTKQQTKPLTFKLDTTVIASTSFQSNLGNELAVTTVKQAVPITGRVYANASLQLTKDDIVDGTQLTIGKTTYTFAVGANSKFKTAANVVDLTKFADNNEAGFLSAALQGLTKAADTNAQFIVASDNVDKIFLTEKEGGIDYTVNNLAGKATAMGDGNWAGLVKFAYADTGTSIGGLQLQIGDTSDQFNQLSVYVGDMHTTAMGTEGGKSIADISINSQENAAAAVDVIKNAINYVSGVRGDLGAVQNRLEHTQNNLSVMTENIQDAESTIRDTDVADEMMKYTKNNILIQSAQAMLAQANQVPQGVLQLLQ